MHSTLAYTAPRRPHLNRPAARERSRLAWLLLPLLLLATGLLLAAGMPADDPHRVSATDFGSQWPLTLKEGELACDDNGAITLLGSDGVRYALNDKAMASGYTAPLAVWRYDEAMPGGVNLPLTPLIQHGSQFCRGGR